MQDGRADHVTASQPYGTFYAGSWPINNRVMAEALEFAGYDAKLVIGDEGHNMKQGAAIMPEALRCVWRDYIRNRSAARGPAAATGQPGFETRGRVPNDRLAPTSLGSRWAETLPVVRQSAGDPEGASAAPIRPQILFPQFGQGQKVAVHLAGTVIPRARPLQGIRPDDRYVHTQPCKRRFPAGPTGDGEKADTCTHAAAGGERSNRAPQAGEIYCSRHGAEACRTTSIPKGGSALSIRAG